MKQGEAGIDGKALVVAGKEGDKGLPGRGVSVEVAEVRAWAK